MPRQKKEASPEPGGAIAQAVDTIPAAACGYPSSLIACPDFLLGALSITVAELIEEAIAPFLLRSRHYRMLKMLMFDGPLLQSKVGPALGIDRTTVVATIDTLEQRKLAKRMRSPEDRRAYHIVITEKGKRTLTEMAACVSAVEERMFAPLTDKEREELRFLCLRLLSQPGVIADAHAKVLRPTAQHIRRAEPEKISEYTKRHGGQIRNRADLSQSSTRRRVDDGAKGGR